MFLIAVVAIATVYVMDKVQDVVNDTVEDVKKESDKEVDVGIREE